MLWLFAPGVLVLIWVLYSKSPARKATQLIENAAQAVEELQAEAEACREGCRSEVSAAAEARKDDIHLIRLQAVSVEELKKYAAGLRLQPLRDVGIRNMADLQSWSQGRLEGLRGVGPKSAATIPGIVQRISSSMRTQPIADPEPPFLRDKERALVLAIYRELQCDHLLAKVPPEFQKLRSDTNETSEQVRTKTSFFRWIWSFGSSDEIRTVIKAAQETARSYEKGNDADTVCERMRALLSGCRSVRFSRVETSALTEAYNEEWNDFDVVLGRSIGNKVRMRRTPPAPLRPEASLVAAAPTQTTASSTSEHTSWQVGPVSTRQNVDETNISQDIEITKSENALKREDAGSGAVTNASAGSLDESKQQAREQLQKYIDSIAPAKFDKEKPSVDHGLTSFRIGVETTVSAFAIPTRASGRSRKAERWIGKNDSVVVQGVTIPRGMVFVSDEADEPAPGVIYPSLEVRAGNYQPSGADMHWQGYAGLTPVQRYHYLHWLADGARSKDFPHFAIFYFHGLERHLVQIAETGHASTSDENDVLEEVRRITREFSEFNTPLSYYSERLISFFELRALPPDAPVELDAPFHRSHELPWRLVYDLGRLAAEQRPVPPALALRWLKLEPNYYPRTPVTRCPEQFDSLFLSMYVAKFGEGMTLPVRGKTLTFQYDPSNYHLRSKDLELTFKALPDVREWANIRSELGALANEVTSKIDAYSRFCGRSPDKANTVQACLLLPREIWPETARVTLEHLKQLASGFLLTEWSLFLEHLGTAEPLPSNQLQDIARGLEAMGLGIEPDLLEGTRRPKAGELCTLFHLTADEEPARTNAAYRNASLAVSLMACVAAADGHASDTEEATAGNIIASWTHLHRDHQTRLQAIYRHQTQQPARLSNLKSRMLSMPQDDRAELLATLAQMVTSDDVVSAAEVKFLEQVYTMLGVDQGQLYTALHKGNIAATRESIDTGMSPRREACPNGFALDLGRIERLKAESAQVSQLLAGVFQDEEPVTAVAMIPEANLVEVVTEPNEADAPAIWPGLGKAETEFLTLLLTKSEWTRQELAAAAAERNMMLDGTLEVINDASFDVLGEALLDGHDPIYVQTTLLENA